MTSPEKHSAGLTDDLQSLLGPEWKGKLALVGFLKTTRLIPENP